MSRFSSDKRKKSPEPFPQGILPKTSVDIAAGSVRYQAQSNINPEGGQTRSYQGSEVDRPDLTVILDNRSGEGSWIVFQDRIDEDQELPAPVSRRNNPSEDEKKQLCQATGLSMSQVSNGMINVCYFLLCSWWSSRLYSLGPPERETRQTSKTSDRLSQGLAPSPL